MDGLPERVSERKSEMMIVAFLIVVGLAVRLLALSLFIDIPGDGPFRAIGAYNWARSPNLVTNGIWLPGSNYVFGVFSFLLPNPLMSIRIPNVIIGTLTIPLFYVLIRKLFGGAAALFSGVVLVFLPLHVGLSASSLTEVSFLFEIVAGIFLLIKATERGKRQGLYLWLSVVCFCLAVMTRYEPWLFIPLFPAFYYWKTKRVSTAILVMAILAVFPVTWVIGNYLHSGDLLPTFSEATKVGVEALGAHPVDLFGAVWFIVAKSERQLGTFVLVAMAFGVVFDLAEAIRGKLSAERGLYLLVLCVFWAFLVYFAMKRGTILWDRYLLFGFIVSTPLAGKLLVQDLGKGLRWQILVIAIAIVSLGITYYFRPSHIFITRKQPVDIKKVASWLEGSPYREDPILLTYMGWESSYLPLFFPETSKRLRYVSHYTVDSKLKDYLETTKPSLLITNEKDREYQSLVETILGKKILADRLVHSVGCIKIYDIKTLVGGQGNKGRG